LRLQSSAAAAARGAAAGLAALPPPSDAIKFTRALEELLLDCPAHGGAGMLMAARALVHSFTQLRAAQAAHERKHMDPLDAFLGMHGARIQRAVAATADAALAASGGSMRDLTTALRRGCVATGSAGRIGGMHAHAALAPTPPAVPVAEGCMHEWLLRCDSMSVHLSDVEDASAEAHASSACMCGARPRPVAESGWDEWDQEWEQGGAAPPVATVPPVAAKDGEWGGGWDDAGDWMDAPPASTLPPSVPLADRTGPQSTSTDVPPSPSEPSAAQWELPGVAGMHAEAEQPKKKKKVIKKVIKKVVKRKVKAPAPAADAAAEQQAAAVPLVQLQAEPPSPVSVGSPLAQDGPLSAACGSATEADAARASAETHVAAVLPTESAADYDSSAVPTGQEAPLEDSGGPHAASDVPEAVDACAVEPGACPASRAALGAATAVQAPELFLGRVQGHALQ
jgi:hypothetical protein